MCPQMEIILRIYLSKLILTFTNGRIKTFVPVRKGILLRTIVFSK